jgi:hypothetical protein
MSFLATDRAWWARRQQRKREAHAEERSFVSIYERKKKHKPSQLLLMVFVGATFVGGSLMLVGSVVGFIMVIVCLPATVATGVWCFKKWDY